MTRIIAHLLRGVALLLAVVVTTAGADVVPAADIVTLAPSVLEGPEPCNIQAETGLTHVITAYATRIPFVIPDGEVFVLTGVSWFDSSGPLTAGADAIQMRLVNSGVSSEMVLTVPTSVAAVAAAVTTHPGILVAPGVAVCARTRTPSTVGAARLEVRVYGYFTKAKLPTSAPRR
jgi:hypothetical protein